MLEAFVSYHIISSVQDKFQPASPHFEGVTFPAQHHCHTPDASAPPWQPSPALGRPAEYAYAPPVYFEVDRKRFPPTEVSGIVIFIIYGTSPFECDPFHAVPRSMHSMHWNPLSFTAWRTHPPPEPGQKVVFKSTGGHSKKISNSLLVPRSMHSNLSFRPYYYAILYLTYVQFPDLLRGGQRSRYPFI